MFKEMLRKLTADYTEEEYREYLREKVVHIEPDGMDEPCHVPSFEFTERLIRGGFHKFKDYDIALHDIADYTGYPYEELNDIFCNHCDPDEPYLDRITSISDISIEQDW